MITLTLPFPPALNSYYRHLGHKVLISEKGREYRKAVADQVLIQRGVKHYYGRLSVHIDAHAPDNRRRDLDGMFKAVLDSLTHAGVWVDDSQIDELSIKRMPLAGMLKITIATL